MKADPREIFHPILSQVPGVGCLVRTPAPVQCWLTELLETGGHLYSVKSAQSVSSRLGWGHSAARLHC